MDSPQNIRASNVFCCNIRGFNAEGKWDSLRNKIIESNYDIISIQETKRSKFDLAYTRKFCPRIFYVFCFLPSVGASGGILVVWKSSLFSGLKSSKIVLLSLWNYLLSMMMIAGSPLLCMPLVVMKESRISSTGLKIYICLMKWIG